VFQYSPFEPSTLGDNAVFFLKEDPSTGKFWIGGSSALNEFDPETFTNIRYRFEKKQLEFSDGVFIDQRNLLLACEYAVLMFDTKKKTFREIPVLDENNQPVAISRVENVASDKMGNFMIMSRRGIFFYDSLSKSCRRKTANSPDFSSFKNYEIFNVLHDKNGHYWIATNKSGLIRFNPVSNEALTVDLNVSIEKGDLRFDVVAEDSRGYIWVGSSYGLFLINPNTMGVERFTSESPAESSLSHNEINAISEDRNQYMWIGTVGSGINKMIPKSSGFRNYTLSKSTGGVATGTYIMALQQMGNTIWFTNIWDQVGKIDMKTGYSEIISSPQLSNYGWYSEGIILKNKVDELTLLNGEYQYQISENPEGEMSFRSQVTPGLFYIYHANNGKTWWFVKSTADEMFCQNDTIFGNAFFYDAKEDTTGKIWIGSSKGLIEFDPIKNHFNQYQHRDNDRNSVSSDFIYALEVVDHTVWMAAYNGGLCSYNIESGTFRHFTREDGLSDNTVYAIQKDHHENLWFSSNAGISAYNTKTKSFRNYSVADGLTNNEFNRRSSFKNEDGWLFFGGISGIDFFHPDSIVKNNITPNLAFTGFRVFNRDFIPSTKGGFPIVELEPGDRQVTIEFASLDYNDQQKIQYAYRINNNDWITTGNQNTLSFSDLHSGSHQFFFRSTNSEGIWLDNEIACLVIVHPWWWQTWWFRLSIVFISLGAMLGAIRFYYHRKLEKQKVILERQQAVERERTRIATDMHDDLGANLSRIKFLSETIGIKKVNEETIDEEISSIRRYSHEMIDKMGEIVWALNEKNDSLSDLLAYTRAYSVEYLSQNGIHTDVQTPEQIPNVFVSGEFRRNVYLTVKEALHNVVKHSMASKVNIQVETKGQLTIRIHDNGKGFDVNDIRPFSNGIGNMKKRLAVLGGNLDIKNSAGSTIILTVPLV
jgi:signal transduction histidine kinase/streptogramin lyase